MLGAAIITDYIPSTLAEVKNVLFSERKNKQTNQQK